MKEAPRTNSSIPNPSADAIDQQAVEALGAVITSSHENIESESEKSDTIGIKAEYEAFRRAEDLSDNAEKFYTVTGKDCNHPFSPFPLTTDH